MRPERYTRGEYVRAFRELAARIAATLQDVPRHVLPVHMYVAGGAALHFHTGERVSVDVDAAFSRRIALPDELEVTDRDDDGAARLLYLDQQYNETLGLAVSKIGRLSAQDQSDIAALARRGLVTGARLAQRAEEALDLYVGDTRRLRGNIATAVRIVAENNPTG